MVYWIGATGTRISMLRNHMDKNLDQEEETGFGGGVCGGLNTSCEGFKYSATSL